MQKLNNEETLNKVTGGTTITGDKEECERHMGASVGMYNLVVGKKYVVKEHRIINGSQNDNYFIGICINTWEDSMDYGTTVRVHKFRKDNGFEVEVSGTSSTVWEYI